jgi:hypothetical protein
MELWELVARERIRDSLMQYTWSGDALRITELALAFCEDGVLEIKGRQPWTGRHMIVTQLSRGSDRPVAKGAVRRIVRHNIANIRFLEMQRERALVASYFTVVTEVGLDHYGRYRDTFVPVGEQWLIQHRFVSVDWHAESSTFS